MAGFGGAAHIVGVHAGSHGGFTDYDVAVALAKLDALGVRIVNLSLGGSYPSSPIARRRDPQGRVRRNAHRGRRGERRRGSRLLAGRGPAAERRRAAATASPSARRTRTAASPRSPTPAGTSRSSRPGTSRATARACSSRSRRRTCSAASCYPQWSGPGGATYGYVAGTSFSSPEVAGVAALVWAARPELKNYQVADIVKAVRRRAIAGAGWTSTMGCGRLDAAAAVELALSRTPCEWAPSSTGVGIRAPPTEARSRRGRRESQTITFGRDRRPDDRGRRLQVARDRLVGPADQVLDVRDLHRPLRLRPRARSRHLRDHRVAGGQRRLRPGGPGDAGRRDHATR